MVPNHSISILLEQAQDAASQGNWMLLTQHLQQLQEIVPVQNVNLAATNNPEHQTDVFHQVLKLALLVLEQGDFYDRWEIAKLLPAFDAPIIPPLLEFLQDAEADWELRWFTARILGEMKHPSVTAALLNVIQTDFSRDDDLTAIVAEALVSLGTGAISALTELLVVPATRLPAVKALAQMRHPDTLPALLSVANDAQPTIRVITIEALGNFHDPRIIPILEAALQDPVAAVRQEAVTVLGLHPNIVNTPDLLEKLHHRLSDTHLAVQQQTVTALARLGTDSAANILFQTLLNPTTPEVLQIEIVRALGWMNSSLTLTYLQKFLLEASPTLTVMREVVTVLGRFKEAALRPLAVDILLSLSSSARFDVQDTETKQALTVSLGELGHAQAIDCLIQLMGDADVGVRLHAIAALKKLDPTETNLQRIQALAHDTSLSPELRQSAAMALQEW